MRVYSGGLEENLRKDKSSSFKSWEENTYRYLCEHFKDVEERLSKITSGSYNGRTVKCIGIKCYFDWSLDKRLNPRYSTFLCEIPEEGRIQEIIWGALAFTWK